MKKVSWPTLLGTSLKRNGEVKKKGKNAKKRRARKQ
jgi:hypothetical protein